MKSLSRTLSVARAILRHAWVGLVVVICLLLGWLLRGGLAPVGGGESSSANSTPTPTEAGEPEVWTCSMHAQIQLPGPGQCPLCFMDLIQVEDEAGAGEGLRRLAMSPAARALADIRTAPVERRSVEAEVHMVGKIDYDETRLAYITAWVAGRIDRLFVDYTGVEVREGDHMVVLYSPELYAAQAELLQALRAAEETERRGTVASAGLARSTLEAAREKLRLWGLKPGQIEELESRGTATYRVTIYAPTSGIVVHRDAQQGMYVDTGSTIYTLADLSHLWVRLEAYEADLPWLRYGQEIEFTTRAWPGEVFRGTVAFIDPVVDARKRTIQVRVNVDNSERKLKPEMFVRAHVHAQVAGGGLVMDPSLAGKWICPMHPEIVKAELSSCDECGMDLVTSESLGYVTRSAADEPLPLVIPASAPLLTGRRAVVYVEVPGEDGPVFEGREVVLGPRAGDWYVVEHGLAEGERVVVNGSFKIDSALQIQARPSMMLPEGGGSGGGAHDHGAEPGGGSDRVSVHALHAGAVSPVMARGLALLERSVTVIGTQEELEPRRAAFAELEQAIEAVDVGGLEGEALALWQELAMKLGNDAAEGARASEPGHAEASLLSARRTLERIVAGFGRHEDTLVEGFVTPPGFRLAVGAVWRAYLELHAALAGDDREASVAALGRLDEALDDVDAGGLQAEAADAWTAARDALRTSRSDVEATADLDALRVAFEPLSAAMQRTVETFGVDAGVVYLVHCPMAFDFRGANWLQADQEVLNPYFGAEMLRCGTVQGAVPQPAILLRDSHDKR